MTHERAAVMALTFVIGFTTGLIAYGLPVADAPVAYVPPTSQTASAISASAEVEEADVLDQSVAQPTIGTTQAYAEVDTAGLHFITDAGERLLVSVAVGNGVDGIRAHTAIHQPLPSPDGRFLFYCAEYADTAGACDALVFSAENNTLRPVTVDTLQVPSRMRTAWSSDGRLQINQQVSLSAAQPWEVE